MTCVQSRRTAAFTDARSFRSKLKLYASLHSTLAAHRTILADREETLNNARESLRRGGDNVVSSKISVGLGEEKKPVAEN